FNADPMQTSHRFEVGGYAHSGAPALGDVEAHALDPHQPPRGVELGLRGLLEPYLPAVGTQKAIGDRIRRVFSIESAPQRLHAHKVIWMDLRKEGRAVKGLLRLVPQNLRRVAAAPGQTGGYIPLEGQHAPGCERLLQGLFAVCDHGSMLTP